ncbi:alpha/beta hydrolase [Caulobacter sp. 17J80-11]|nr:alpha/beta hydrolase [Caulobacter sp. 17J80-11]
MALGGYLVWSWWQAEQVIRPFGGEPGEARLYWGLGLLALSLLGRAPVLGLLARSGAGTAAEPLIEAGRESVAGPEGARLHVESFGPPEAPAIILTHGWGLSSIEWREARRQLADRYRVVVWDLPGLGLSEMPVDRRLDLPRLAAGLKAVLDLEAGRPALLVGHSIGGMIVQEFCRRYPQALGREVSGLVLENTTYTDPLKTTALSAVLAPLQKPLFEPLMKLDKVLFPLVWAMNWQSYLSGSAHLAMRVGGFGTRPSRAQLDRVTRLVTRHSPAVQAEGNLAMMRWDATGAMAGVRCPVLLFIGGRDLVTRPRAGEAIAQQNPAIEVARIDRAGHMGPVECADAYDARLLDFADRAFTAKAVWADRRAGERAAAEERRGQGRPQARGEGPPATR